MSKRYRNSFKRTLCRWTDCRPRRTYENVRSNNHYYNHNYYSPHHLSPSAYPTTATQRLNPMNSSLNHYRDNIFTFTMLKYKIVIGSRTFSRENVHSGKCRSQTSFHYRLSLIEKQEREQDKENLKLQLQRRNFSLNFIQQPKKRQAKLIFATNLSPLTPPNSSISDSKMSHTYK